MDRWFNPGSTRGLRCAGAALPSVVAMNAIQLVLIAAVIVLVIGRRFAGQPLRAQSLVIPVGLTAWAGYQLAGVHLTGADIGFLLISVVLGLGSGAARGITVHLYSRDGHLWMRYRWLTAVVWVASIALRVGLVAGGHLTGVGLSASSTILLTLGVSLIAEAGVVGARAAHTGVPYAPGGRAVSAARFR